MVKLLNSYINYTIAQFIVGPLDTYKACWSNKKNIIDFINQFDRKTIISPYDRIFYGKHKYFEPAFEKIKNRNNIYNKLFDNLLYKCEKNYSNISHSKNLF